ncbi:MAG: STAS domain-containing protein [Candidatus Viridilinea halotolerans]|uniref:STAS domain-containing protein n=1 Tax=Candidatus Viridilinea halotolerans TaxID=2491704 RepID=A0A426TWC1_9CHLR|nr:MAG: STAS domain-containing protein [Candidatus Viridilinea halotolerans]
MIMIVTLFALCLVVVQITLGVFVALQGWDYRPARFFTYLTALIVLIVGSTLVRDTAPTLALAYPFMAALIIGVSLYITLLMLLVGALFFPQWWEGSRPIRWITLPYIIATAIISVDLILRLQIFVGVAYFDGTYRLSFQMPNALMMILLAFLGQVVVVVMLIVAFFTPQHRELRTPIGLLIIATIFSITMGMTAGQFSGALARLSTLLQSLPILVVLGYLILGTRLFTPNRAAIDLALQATPEGVAVADRNGKITFSNPSAQALGFQMGQTFTALLDTTYHEPIAQLAQGGGGELRIEHQERLYDLALTPVHDHRGARRGTLLLTRDMTERAQRRVELEQERAQLAATVAQLEASQRERANLNATIQALALPLIPVLPGVLILPLIGDFTHERIDDFMSILLEGIEARRARTVLVDLTGLALLDMAGAQGILAAIRAAELLGAHCVLVGIRPEVAEALVALGLPLDGLTAAATLEQAVLGMASRG